MLDIKKGGIMKRIDKEVEKLVSEAHKDKKIEDITIEARKKMLSDARRNLYKDPDTKERNEEIQEEIKKIFEDRLLKIDEAATLLGVTPQTLRNWDKSGKLKSVRTEGGHRRYKESEINALRMEQMGGCEILLHKVTPVKIQKLVDTLVGAFDPLETINLTVRHDSLREKVRIIVESEDGLHTVSHSFKLER
jgi:excisionase family DNA binding protein